MDTSDPVKLLTAAHVLLAAGEKDKAIQLLSKLPDSWKYRVGVLSSLVCLYLGRDDRPAVAALLKAAVEWNKKQPAGTASGDGMATVWRKTAEFHLKTGEAKVKKVVGQTHIIKTLNLECFLCFFDHVHYISD